MGDNDKPKAPGLELGRFRELLVYDPESGALTWGVSRKNTRRAGMVAGRIHRSGYVLVEIDGVCYAAHRIAWLLTAGTWPAMEIDHINGNRSDNRIANLREASHTENMRNRPTLSNSVAQQKGVRFDARCGKWQARITISRRQKHLGYFATQQEAGAAYKLAAKKLFGEFARGS